MTRWRTATFPAVFAAAVLSLVIAGCGKSGPPAPSGTYQSKFGPDQSFSLKFMDSNQVEATFREGGQDKSYRTSFVTSGDTIVMAVPEGERQSGGPDSLTLKRNGEALELTMDGMTMRFDKL